MSPARRRMAYSALVLLALAVPLAAAATPVAFDTSTLANAPVSGPTSLEFGPDGRLYVSQQNGRILAFTIVRHGPNDYEAVATETIDLVRDLPNHDDDGTLNPAVASRQVTGILLAGTATAPILYVSSSDPRIGGGFGGTDLDLDTNSGIVTRLTWNGAMWEHVDLVRGLPRSEENHSSNGMQLDPTSQTLYLMQGGHTNEGAPSNNFAFTPEYALSGALLAIDLAAIGDTTYDLPTLDDEDRPNSGPGGADEFDPFGGNDGKNQARIVPGGPVQVHAVGFRNAYDVLMTEAGRLYTCDNGPNVNWGGEPIDCSNDPSEPGDTYDDSLHFIAGPGFYGGHANPTRGDVTNTFNPSNPQSPVPASNPIECDYLVPGAGNGALETFGASTNGLTEYTASHFGGALQGQLLAASLNGTIWRMLPDAEGDDLVDLDPPNGTLKEALFTGLSGPLDVIAQGDGEPFAGTVWVALYGGGAIQVFEPTPVTAEASLEITPTGGIDASTFGGGSFRLMNDSSGGERITRLSVDLSTSIFFDLVFDPIGTAGDVVAKCFTADAGAGTVGLDPVGDPCVDPFAAPRDGGYDVLEVSFSDFDPGELFTFSVDIDPTSIQGSNAPGPNDSGSVSGLELSGARVTIEFDDGFVQTIEPYRVPGSDGGARNTARDLPPAPPAIEVLGVGSTQALVTNAAQTVRLTGSDGDEVALLVVEGGLYTAGVPNGGFDLDPFEANSAVLVTELTGTIGAGGTLDLAVTLTRSDPEAGLNHLAAVTLDADGSGRTSDLSDVHVLQLVDPGLLVATPAVLDFGMVSTDSTETLAVSLTNDGPGPVVLSTIEVAGDVAFSIVDPPPLPATIPPGAAALDVEVAFAPDVAGVVVGTLTVTHDGTNSPSIVSLTGEGVPPVATVGAGEVPAAAFALHQNVPNPFNPHTSIGFRLERSGATTLRVFDVGGALVRELVDEALAPGEHRFVWNGRDQRGRRVASGVYYYELQTGATSETRAMTLLR